MSRRIIPPKYKTKNQYSAEDVEEATRKFKEDGGLIRKLPEQKVLPNILIVPKDGGSAYERIGIMYGMQIMETRGVGCSWGSKRSGGK